VITVNFVVNLRTN